MASRIFLYSLLINFFLPLLATSQVAVVAFDKNGQVMDIDDFKNNGLSAGRWFGVWNHEGESVESTVSEVLVDVDGVNRKVPVIYTKSKADVMEIFYWPCGLRYKVRLKVSLLELNTTTVSQIKQSQIKVLFLNQALVRTRLEHLSAWISRNAQSFEYEKKILELKTELDAFVVNSSSRQKTAANADLVLEKLLNLSRDVVVSTAEKKIADKLLPTRFINLSDISKNEPKNLSNIVIELVEPAFKIGVGQSFGFSSDLSPVTIKNYYRELREAGFNHFVLPVFWDQIADRNNNYSPSEWESMFAVDELVKLGFTLQVHGVIQNGMPQSVRKLKGEQFEAVAMAHLRRTFADFIKRYGNSIVLNEVVNEASSVEFGGLAINERVNFVSTMIKTFRHVFASRDVMINEYDWDRGTVYGHVSNQRVVGVRALSKRLASIDSLPDVMGIEWYQGLRLYQPRFNADLSEPCFDIPSLTHF